MSDKIVAGGTLTTCFVNWRGQCSYWGGDRHGCTRPDGHHIGRMRYAAGQSNKSHTCGCGTTAPRHAIEGEDYE